MQSVRRQAAAMKVVSQQATFEPPTANATCSSAHALGAPSLSSRPHLISHLWTGRLDAVARTYELLHVHKEHCVNDWFEIGVFVQISYISMGFDDVCESCLLRCDWG